MIRKQTMHGQLVPLISNRSHGVLPWLEGPRSPSKPRKGKPDQHCLGPAYRFLLVQGLLCNGPRYNGVTKDPGGLARAGVVQGCLMAKSSNSGPWVSLMCCSRHLASLLTRPPLAQ